MKYNESVCKMIRRPTREVMVGNIGIGADNPIRIQSMTTSNTQDVQETVEQVMRLADAGCEIVRLTVQGNKEALACEKIKNSLVQKGYNTPLVADIHFYPKAAINVIDFVDKVRINPGNFVDKRASFKKNNYDDTSYLAEIAKIEDKFAPLVEKAKLQKKALRIGTNHGSLSDRIMNRFGDTPEGMIESAFEFARICRKMDFHDFIFSMKSSNPFVMIQAYRLLVAKMYELDWKYPLHLGVTEAGEGEDGRVKSAIGIGALLLDGIGDTIRVSLTEDPWFEIAPCKQLIDLQKSYENQGVALFEEKYRTIDESFKRPVKYPKNIPMYQSAAVYLPVSLEQMVSDDFFASIDLLENDQQQKKQIDKIDGLVVDDPMMIYEQRRKVLDLIHQGINVVNEYAMKPQLRLLELSEAISDHKLRKMTKRFSLNAVEDDTPPEIVKVVDGNVSEWAWIKHLSPAMIFFSPKSDRIHLGRQFFDWLQSEKLEIPVILNFSYALSKEEVTIRASAEMGALLCDGLGEGIFIEAPLDLPFLKSLSFSILQAARRRLVKTEFISCPSCGRTLFDLQEVTRRIKKRTDHLAGVKIAIMGCIVNGPGEMADADFGYVGSRPGKIDLYVGKECVEKNIDFDEAGDRLIALIKEHGMWVDPIAEDSFIPK